MGDFNEKTNPTEPSSPGTSHGTPRLTISSRSNSSNPPLTSRSLLIEKPEGHEDSVLLNLPPQKIANKLWPTRKVFIDQRELILAQSQPRGSQPQGGRGGFQGGRGGGGGGFRGGYQGGQQQQGGYGGQQRQGGYGGQQQGGYGGQQQGGYQQGGQQQGGW